MTCLLEEMLESAAGVVMDVAKVANVATERASSIGEVAGTVGLASPARRSGEKSIPCHRKMM